MDNIERLKKKLQESKQKAVESTQQRNVALPTASIPFMFDLQPFVDSLEEHLKDFFAIHKAEEMEDYRKAIHAMIKSEISENTPIYQQLAKTIDDRFNLLDEQINTVRSKQETVKFPTELTVKQPSWFKGFSDSKILNAIDTLGKTFVSVLTKALIRIDMSLHSDPTRAIAVKLVDLEDKFYKAKSRSGGSTGGSSGRSEGASLLGAGRKTVTSAGTAVAIVATSTTAKRVIISALTDNTDVVYVGTSSALATDGSEVGIPLYASNTVELFVADLRNIYVDARVSGEGITYYYEN